MAEEHAAARDGRTPVARRRETVGAGGASAERGAGRLSAGSVRLLREGERRRLPGRGQEPAAGARLRAGEDEGAVLG